MTTKIIALAKKDTPGIPKTPSNSLNLITNIGIEGDYHAGEFVRHRHLAKKNPLQKNLRQVLIIDNGIHQELEKEGIHLAPGMMGENIILSNIDIMNLPINSILEFHSPAHPNNPQPPTLKTTEIRTPCKQLNQTHPELLKAVIDKKGEEFIYKAGIMAIVVKGGTIKINDTVKITKPEIIS